MDKNLILDREQVLSGFLQNIHTLHGRGSKEKKKGEKEGRREEGQGGEERRERGKEKGKKREREKIIQKQKCCQVL